MFRSILVIILGLFLVSAQPALAELSLDAAKAQGLVGERPDGLIAAVKSPSAEVQQLVSTVNAERLQKYADIAAKNGTAAAQVQALAGKKLIENAPAGTFVQDAAGNWVQR
jgi:uncharacterized protein YdbL (DUF1318 family)